MFTPSLLASLFSGTDPSIHGLPLKLADATVAFHEESLPHIQDQKEICGSLCVLVKERYEKLHAESRLLSQERDEILLNKGGNKELITAVEAEQRRVRKEGKLLDRLYNESREYYRSLRQRLVQAQNPEASSEVSRARAVQEAYRALPASTGSAGGPAHVACDAALTTEAGRLYDVVSAGALSDEDTSRLKRFLAQLADAPVQEQRAPAASKSLMEPSMSPRKATAPMGDLPAVAVSTVTNASAGAAKADTDVSGSASATHDTVSSASANEKVPDAPTTPRQAPLPTGTNPTSVPTSADPATPESDAWACSACTFKNPSVKFSCSICHAPKPPSRRPRRDRGSLDGGTADLKRGREEEEAVGSKKTRYRNYPSWCLIVCCIDNPHRYTEAEITRIKGAGGLGTKEARSVQQEILRVKLAQISRGFGENDKYAKELRGWLNDLETV